MMSGMNRRGFLGAMIRASVAAMALPAATTYARIWVPKKEGIRFIQPQLLVPYWQQISRISMCYDEKYVSYIAHMNEFWWGKPVHKEDLETI